jgi:hypothetical protein
VSHEISIRAESTLDFGDFGLSSAMTGPLTFTWIVKRVSALPNRLGPFVLARIGAADANEIAL